MQEKTDRDSKELIFKPKISNYESKGKPSLTKLRNRNAETFEFKPKINRKSKQITQNDIRREQDPTTRLYAEAKERQLKLEQTH